MQYWTQLDKCGMTSCPGASAEGAPTEMVDLWEQSNFGVVSGPATSLNNSQTCSQSNQAASCVYEDDIFHSRVIQVINQHAATASKANPLFLHWTPHASHGPLEAPQTIVDKFHFMPDP
jgi:hypothetical protein